MSERTVSEDDVRRERLSAVHEPAHWAYLAAVLGGGTIVMLLFIAFLGS